MVSTILILFLGKLSGIVKIPDFDRGTFRKVSIVYPQTILHNEMTFLLRNLLP